jgi:hypothetical protein
MLKVCLKWSNFSLFTGDCDLEWCDGVGLLIILILLTYLGLIYYHIIKKFFGMLIYKNILTPIHEWWNRLMAHRWGCLDFKCTFFYIIVKPIPIGMQSHGVLSYLRAGIMGLNPKCGTNICVICVILHCPVLVEVLCWSDTPSKKICQLKAKAEVRPNWQEHLLNI